MMVSQRDFSKRFRYPLYYIILFSIALLFCVFSSLYMLFENIQITAALVMLGLNVVWLYLLYELTQTILIDQQGIAQDSIFGEMCRFSWGEIQGIKPNKNIFSPGFKVYNHNGDSIEISTMLGQYDAILELIRRTQAEFGNKPLSTLSQEVAASASSEPVSDWTIRASKYGWAGLLVFVTIPVLMFVGSIYYLHWIYVLLFGLWVFVGIPYMVYDYFRKPTLVATRGEYLYIKFRSKRLRKNIRVKAIDVRDISINHRRILTQHGALHAETNIVVELWKNTKVDLSSIGVWQGVSNEDLYLRLCAWREKYGNLDPSEIEEKRARAQSVSY